ncbi:hypothetical protein B0A52_01031 [Exophiala mesophila]|uniref:Xylanolytic transcriptional activator regulatory domain-containing protein n=1 Tax=Exophiala mesophila TaxID=212818 RepID=A0A438NGA3_EXOME|nr:hypothetical protein B0A52_01031 [Exophiala mesophila]
MNQVLSRLRRVEDFIQQQGQGTPSVGVEGRPGVAPIKRTVSSVTEFNRQTGCFEYYGETSSFVVASSLGKRLNRFNDGDSSVSASRGTNSEQGPLPEDRRPSIGVPGLQTLLDAYDYVMPLNTPVRRYRSLQQDVADRHLDNFFATIHVYFPIFDVSAFRAKYSQLRELFGSNLLHAPNGDIQGQQQSLCLLYAILALGALYAADEDSSSWASWYFSEAQELLGRLYDAVNLQLVQAAMFMGAYAQHALKPNLAYNLAGTATRMAFSIGLNLDPTLASHDWDGEEGRRTWWMLFIQEVELSVDSGRPMSIRKSDISVQYPSELQTQSQPPQYQMSDFIRHLAGVAQITRDILKFVVTSTRPVGTDPSWEAKIHKIHHLLVQWRARLPIEIKFEDGGLDQDLVLPNSWASRHRSSLLVHYNLALVVLHRFSLMSPEISPSEDLTRTSQPFCIDAAGAIILHIHGLFQVAPNLRRWRYYCYYCLQATLVLLIKLVDEPLAEQNRSIVAKCHLSIVIFKQIELKVAQRCAELVVSVLNSRQKQQTSEDIPEQRAPEPSQPGIGPSDPALGSQQVAAQLPTKEAQYGIMESATDEFSAGSCPDLTFSGTELDFSVDDDLWNDFVKSGMHTRPFESWMNILNDQEAL